MCNTDSPSTRGFYWYSWEAANVRSRFHKCCTKASKLIRNTMSTSGKQLNRVLYHLFFLLILFNVFALFKKYFGIDFWIYVEKMKWLDWNWCMIYSSYLRFKLHYVFISRFSTFKWCCYKWSLYALIITSKTNKSSRLTTYIYNKLL